MLASNYYKYVMNKYCIVANQNSASNSFRTKIVTNLDNFDKLHKIEEVFFSNASTSLIDFTNNDVM